MSAHLTKIKYVVSQFDSTAVTETLIRPTLNVGQLNISNYTFVHLARGTPEG